ncbi:hypothetical protein HPP92_019661 [Vanilla planifolia]|uniref:PB1 domain-containing protein n=1 Tax=Vanilla planifolia TaxID=51239 RepID=A0A835QA17_VANPL|nr:hypothetical protein HPP92_019661 [Vanilla planifolia]
MADVYCSPVAIRYQLPDEDLDALITVSSAEDLENMMDEYDKLAEASVDGSAKLRVFLFSPSELASAIEENSSAGPGLVDLYENEQKYIEAVNGYVVSDVGRSNWKESTVSFSVSHNLDAGINETKNVGIFPAVSSSLASAYFDPSSLHLVGCPISMPLQETLVFPVSSTAVSHTTGATQTLKQFQVGTYASHVYAEPHQIQCIPRCSLAMATAPQISSMATAPQHAYLPPLNLQPGSIPLQVGSVNQVQGKMESCSDEDQFDGRTVQPFSDHSCKGLNQPLSQLPPLHHSHLQTPNTEQYRVHQVPPLPKVLVKI